MEHKLKEMTATLGQIYGLGLFRYVDVTGTVSEVRGETRAEVRAEVRADEEEEEEAPKYRRRRRFRDLQGMGRYNPWK